MNKSIETRIQMYSLTALVIEDNCSHFKDIIEGRTCWNSSNSSCLIFELGLEYVRPLTCDSVICLGATSIVAKIKD